MRNQSDDRKPWTFVGIIEEMCWPIGFWPGQYW